MRPNFLHLIILIINMAPKKKSRQPDASDRSLEYSLLKELRSTNPNTPINVKIYHIHGLAATQHKQFKMINKYFIQKGTTRNNRDYGEVITADQIKQHLICCMGSMLLPKVENYFSDRVTVSKKLLQFTTPKASTQRGIQQLRL